MDPNTFDTSDSTVIQNRHSGVGLEEGIIGNDAFKTLLFHAPVRVRSPSPNKLGIVKNVCAIFAPQKRIRIWHIFTTAQKI